MKYTVAEPLIQEAISGEGLSWLVCGAHVSFLLCLSAIQHLTRLKSGISSMENLRKNDLHLFQEA